MQTLREEQGPPLPLSSLRLFVPPLRLVCAALWQVIEQRNIMDYGLLEEFATTVLEIVPELMSYRERVQLLMGLRARLVLELCRCDDELCRPDTVQPHLNRMRSCISNHKGEVSDPNVEASEASFTKLIETLMEEPKERELFFQRIWQYVQPASQLQTTYNHAIPRTPLPASSPAGSSETSHPESLLNCGFAHPKNFCPNCQIPSHGN
uniref:TERF1-interacting nuclear factor 2 N-terminal domain-containing protein n=1 Tax=Hucho hucho TaxID=62062 RepID=A0A4W5P517_9TELE